MGYIYEVVKDQQLAEQYLVQVFNQLPEQLDTADTSIRLYLRLQLIARKLLAAYFENGSNHIPSTATTYLPFRQNKYLDNMNNEQQHVFCKLHYCGKSISQLAAELQRPESDIKQILKEAFDGMRRIA